MITRPPITGYPVAKALGSIGKLTEVKSNVIMQVAAGTAAPLIMYNSPFVENKGDKKYAATKQFLVACVGLATQLAVSIPITKTLDSLAEKGKIPLPPGSEKLKAAELAIAAATVIATTPVCSYIVNKLVPIVSKLTHGSHDDHSNVAKHSDANHSSDREKQEVSFKGGWAA